MLLKTGDLVAYKQGYRRTPKTGVIANIGLVQCSALSTIDTDSIDTSLQQKFVVDFEDGHWAYGEQLCL